MSGVDTFVDNLADPWPRAVCRVVRIAPPGGSDRDASRALVAAATRTGAGRR